MPFHKADGGGGVVLLQKSHQQKCDFLWLWITERWLSLEVYSTEVPGIAHKKKINKQLVIWLADFRPTWLHGETVPSLSSGADIEAEVFCFL